jgi:hypothetical protein
MLAGFNVMAQDTITIDQAGGLLESPIQEILGSYFVLVGGLATILVSFLKFTPFFRNTSAPTVQLLVTVSLVVIVVVLERLGYGDQAKSAVTSITEVGSVLLKVLMSWLGSTAIHEGARAYRVAIIGAKRHE